MTVLHTRACASRQLPSCMAKHPVCCTPTHPKALHHTPATAGPARAGGRRQRRSASPAPAAPPPSACLHPPTSPERGLRRGGRGEEGWRNWGICVKGSRRRDAGASWDPSEMHHYGIECAPRMRDCASSAHPSHVWAQQAGKAVCAVAASQQPAAAGTDSLRFIAPASSIISLPCPETRMSRK